MSISVRHAVTDDIDFLVSELQLFSQFFGTHKSLFPSITYAREALKSFIKTNILLIADKAGVGPVGFIGGAYHKHFMNPDITVLTELFWWVQKSYRHTRAGLLLLNKYIDEGKKIADWLTVSLEHKSTVNARSLTRRGFKLHEHSYIMEVA